MKIRYGNYTGALSMALIGYIHQPKGMGPLALKSADTYPERFTARCRLFMEIIRCSLCLRLVAGLGRPKENSHVHRLDPISHR